MIIIDLLEKNFFLIQDIIRKKFHRLLVKSYNMPKLIYMPKLIVDFHLYIKNGL